MKRFGIVVASALLALGLSSGVAVADPVDDYVASTGPTAVCPTLDNSPTFAGLFVLLKLVGNDGFSAYDAGTIVAKSVINYCPHHVGLLMDFVDVYSDDDSSGADYKTQVA